MARKAVFIDVDGTLVDHHGEVPVSAVEAIGRARSLGHLVFLSTGRSMCELWPGLLGIGFDGIVAGAGAYVEAGGRELTHHVMSEGDVERVRSFFDGHGLDYLFEGAHGLFGTRGMNGSSEHILATMFPDADARARARSSSFCYVDQIQPLPAGALPIRVSKLLFRLDEQVGFDDVRAEFPAFLVLQSSVGVFGRLCGEMQLPGIHKARGLETIVEHLGLDRADTIALGDSDNDLEMLRYAGVGIAMGNARPQVLAVADEVTSSVADHGVQRAFERHGLLG